MSPKMKRINKKDLEEQAKRTEELWREIQAAQPQEEKTKLIILSPGVDILLSSTKGLGIEKKQEETGVYSLVLSKGRERLTVLLDVESREISIGDKDYRIKEDKLIELAPWSTLDLIRRETKKRFLMDRQDDSIIIDLGKIEDNSELRQFIT